MAVSGQVPAGRDGRPGGPTDPAAQVCHLSGNLTVALAAVGATS
jgi:hypothetical protein